MESYKEVMTILNKSLIMLSILLVALLAVSAASAADNITEAEPMDDGIEEPLGEVDASCQDALKSDENDDAELEDDDGFQVQIYRTNLTIADPEGDYGDIGTVYCPYGIMGNITVSAGDDVVHTYELDEYGSSVYLDYFTLKLPFGKYLMKIDFVNQTSTKQLYSGLINVDYYMNIDSGRYFDDEDATDYPLFYDDSWTYRVEVPRDADGKLYVSFDGNYYETATYNKRGNYVKTTSVNGLSIGAHNIVAKLLDDSFYPNKTVEHTFYVSPKITVPNSMSVGEKEFILIDLPDDYRGTVRIYNGTVHYDEYNDEYYLKDQLIATADVNGDVKIEMPSLKMGKNAIFVNLTGSGDFEDYFTMDYYQNDPNFSSSISSNEVELGGDVILTINAPKSNRELYISVDGQEYSEVDLNNGGTKLPISRLSLGQHHIKLEFCSYSYDGNHQRVVDKFYSNSFYVTVKEKAASQNTPSKDSKPASKTTLTLKKVKVKKSAKKLILQATLKQDGKALSGKKITFKFNGRKYSAKTNKKGVAKVTVKKSVLKKLKVGKNVKYQATYGKITVKKSAKVKK